MTSHIRRAIPRRRGNDRYLDRSDRTSSAATLCGAEVTDQDVDARSAEAAARKGWPVCADCLRIARKG